MPTRRSDDEIASDLKVKLRAVTERQARKDDVVIRELQSLAGRLRTFVNARLDSRQDLTGVLLSASAALENEAEERIDAYAARAKRE